MSSRPKTKEEYDKEIGKISEYIESMKAEQGKLYARMDRLERMKMERFDPEYRKQQETIRKNRKLIRQLVAGAGKKFTGKWRFIDAGTYIRISGVGKPLETAIDLGELCPGQIVFPTYYDIKVVAGYGICNIEIKGVHFLDKRCVNLTLYAEDCLAVSKKYAMEDVAMSVAGINENFGKLCKVAKWKRSSAKKNG